jgi:ubiquinone/menaquinone biosynthesis C-methylase UbiE
MNSLPLRQDEVSGATGHARGEIFRRMLDHPRYLFRPWIPIVKAMEGEVFARLALRPPTLDVACGDGIFSWATYGRVLDVGIDIDFPSLGEAKRLGAYRALAAADARALPFPSASFRSVTSVCAVEHMDDLPVVLRELARVLMPGGRLYMTVPSEQFGDLLLASRIWRGLGCPGRAAAYGARKNARSHHVNVLSEAGWRSALGAASLQVAETAYLLDRRVMTLWSLATSTPFKLAFLPFRLARDREWPWAERLLRRWLVGIVVPRLKRAPEPDPSVGGYLFLAAQKADR